MLGCVGPEGEGEGEGEGKVGPVLVPLESWCRIQQDWKKLQSCMEYIDGGGQVQIVQKSHELVGGLGLVGSGSSSQRPWCIIAQEIVESEREERLWPS